MQKFKFIILFQSILYKFLFFILGDIACDGTCLTITSVTMAAGGDYICSASNGVGHPAHATIHVDVLCKYLIKVFYATHCQEFLRFTNWCLRELAI